MVPYHLIHVVFTTEWKAQSSQRVALGSFWNGRFSLLLHLKQREKTKSKIYSIFLYLIKYVPLQTSQFWGEIFWWAREILKDLSQ